MAHIMDGKKTPSIQTKSGKACLYVDFKQLMQRPVTAAAAACDTTGAWLTYLAAATKL